MIVMMMIASIMSTATISFDDSVFFSMESVRKEVFFFHAVSTDQLS